MPRRKTLVIAFSCLLAGLCLSQVGWAATTARTYDISLVQGVGYATVASLYHAIPGGTFVITIAHVPPSPEEAFVRGIPAACDPVRFRIDILKVSAEDGSMEVELGDRELLEVGEVFQIVHTIEPDGRTGVPAFERDMLGFRLRSESAAAPCNVVSSGLFYAEPMTRTPTVVSLIPSAGPSRGARRNDDR